MKTRVPYVAVLAIALHSMAGAFTLDAVGYDGGGLAREPVSIQVAGYGEMVFEAAVDTALVVGSGYQNAPCAELPQLSFDADEAVGIVFKGMELTGSDHDVVHVSAREGTQIGNEILTPHTNLVTFERGGKGGGLEVGNTERESVPEPAAAIIGLIGGALLVLLRRR